MNQWGNEGFGTINSAKYIEKINQVSEGIRNLDSHHRWFYMQLDNKKGH